MSTHQANAHPRKRFFLEMFTRDISLEDCILDLIDNSIDALSRTRNLDLSPPLLKALTSRPKPKKALPQIDIIYTANEFTISDNCGGIEPDHALKEVFSFGHSPGYHGGQLGVYGIGLKRALFKIGRYFEIHSKTKAGGFKVELDVEEWAKKDDSPDDWMIPLTDTTGAKSLDQSATSIRITKLSDEVEMRLRDKTLETSLHSSIGVTYSLFLEKVVRVRINKKTVQPFVIPVGDSTKVSPANEDFSVAVGNKKVPVKLIASLAARSSGGEWSVERAGWYVFCNNRVVVAADKSELTGWDRGLPKYHSKYNGFVGLAFFQSKDLSLLPWTTTKRGINRDSVVYQQSRNHMDLVAKPIISFLNKMYPSDLAEDPQQRSIAEGIKQTKLSALAGKGSSPFNVKPSKVAQPTTTKIQYDARRSDIEKIRRHIKQPSWGASKVGEYTFKHFLETECD